MYYNTYARGFKNTRYIRGVGGLFLIQWYNKSKTAKTATYLSYHKYIIFKNFIKCTIYEVIMQNQQFINIKQDTDNNSQSGWRSGKISHSAEFRSVDRTPNPL